MSFTNPPLQGKPPANALGLQSVQQIEREARSNQIAPSADIMVRRTTKGTLLSLRNKGTAGDDPAVFMTTVANYLHAPLVNQPHLECGEVFVVDDAGRIIAPPPTSIDSANAAQQGKVALGLGPHAGGGWYYPHGTHVAGGAWRLASDFVLDFYAHGEPILVAVLGTPIKVPIATGDSGFLARYQAGQFIDGRPYAEATHLDLNLKSKYWVTVGP